jgi:hypothetical protein
MSGKKRGYAFDVDAWIQFHLLRLASHHGETTKADLAVLAEIIQRYWGKYGNGWISHDQLCEVAGLSKATVIRSKRNLERLGFITIVQPGRRGSATVYKPNFDMVPRKGVTDDTETLGSMDDTKMVGLGVVDDTETTEYGITDDTPSYLPDRPTRAGSQIDRHDPATPTAPLPVGLTATGAVTAGEEGFKELWKAYYPGKGSRRADAEAAYKKIAPDDAQHREMVDAAHAWYERWAAQGKPDAPRYTLVKWLERGEYECAPPVGYQQKNERKPKAGKPKQAPDIGIAKPEPVANNNNEPDTDEVPWFLIGSPKLWPVGRFVGEFVDGEVKMEGPDKIVTMDFEIQEGEHAGRILQHRFYVEAFIRGAQEEGQAILSRMCTAVGLTNITNTDELQFKPLVAIADGHTVTYEVAAQEAA